MSFKYLEKHPLNPHKNRILIKIFQTKSQTLWATMQNQQQQTKRINNGHLVFT